MTCFFQRLKLNLIYLILCISAHISKSESPLSVRGKKSSLSSNISSFVFLLFFPTGQIPCAEKIVLMSRPGEPDYNKLCGPNLSTATSSGKPARTDHVTRLLLSPSGLT